MFSLFNLISVRTYNNIANVSTGCSSHPPSRNGVSSRMLSAQTLTEINQQTELLPKSILSFQLKPTYS